MKRIMSLALAVLLAAALVCPALAVPYTEGITLSAEEQSNINAIAGAIKTQYGVDAYFLLKPDLDDGDMESYTEKFAESLDNEAAIVFTVTKDSYYLYPTYSATERLGIMTDYEDDLYESIRDADERGEAYNMAIQYYAALNTRIVELGNVPDTYVSTTAAAGTDSTAASTGAADATDATLPISGTSASHVLDEAGLLSESERVSLAAKLDALSEKLQMDVLVRTVDDFDGAAVDDYAEQWYDASEYGQGENKDGCMLLLSMADRDWCITSTGFAETALDSYGRAYIGDAILDKLSDGDYAEAFESFADYVDIFAAQAQTGEPYTSTNPYKEPIHYGKRIVFALAVGLIVALIASSVVKGKYKPVKLQSGASGYMVNGSLVLTASYENFLYHNVTRTPKSNSSSSSGGSSTSSSGRSTSGKF